MAKDSGSKVKTARIADDRDLAAALEKLAEAERAYSVSDDLQVFISCRKMIEALPGFPDDLFAKAGPGSKQKALGRIYREAAEFFRVGRRLGKDQTRAGELLVDHRDAGLALGLARALLAYLSSD